MKKALGYSALGAVALGSMIGLADTTEPPITPEVEAEVTTAPDSGKVADSYCEAMMSNGDLGHLSPHLM